MKRILFIMSLVVGLASVQASCGGDAAEPKLSVSTHKLSFTHEVGEQTFIVTTNVGWSISGAEGVAWLNVDPASGKGTGATQVRVTAQLNPDLELRSATLTVTAGELIETIEVTQAYLDVLEVDSALIEGVSPEGGTVEVKIKSSGEPTVSIEGNWITADGTGTPSGDYNIVLKFRLAAFDGYAPRSGSVTLQAGAARNTVVIVQNAPDPGIPADDTGMTDDAVAMAAKMGIGWNIGNTMEPPAGEGTWNNPPVTRELIKMVADAGFKTIRIPCGWDSHIIDRSTHKLNPAWLDRVAEVVGWCLEEDLYVTINIHWDGGWLQDNPFYANQEEINRKMAALWKQIGVRMRDFDQKLIFSGTNEVQVNFGPPTNENLEVQESFNQTFVDAVRSTGGRNAYRNLVVQAYNTNIDNAVERMTMPEDSAERRLFVEVHYYDPYEFTIMPGNDPNVKIVWGNRPEAPVEGADRRKANWGDENFADGQFAKMKRAFVDKGIPVIVGEYGGTFRTGLGADQADHDASNVYFLGYLTHAMVANGLIPVYWDNGATSGTPDSEGSGLFDRRTYKAAHPKVLEAMMKE